MGKKGKVTDGAQVPYEVPDPVPKTKKKHRVKFVEESDTKDTHDAKPTNEPAKSVTVEIENEGKRKRKRLRKNRST
ncbi:unnamed protein product [Nippostrongylus brasiliensis]|uniref:Hva1_TUDOR domain-containing protein n=1 Tax=Nippostrongylus brasiliensis TaxID=27835 RepID=A0A0N4XMB5_NIPBR|nr:unnamed protein product [Nippostrongylus brasiliensis]